jgi:transketolase N-terminal domain/subunit
MFGGGAHLLIELQNVAKGVRRRHITHNVYRAADDINDICKADSALKEGRNAYLVRGVERDTGSGAILQAIVGIVYGGKTAGIHRRKRQCG